ncbi:MAG TPA: hypothetical protein ENN87_10835 [Phycisphaerales bacterium]|nr:hypothetical protein [Phycisphaerales bacterium]
MNRRYLHITLPAVLLGIAILVGVGVAVWTLYAQPEEVGGPEGATPVPSPSSAGSATAGSDQPAPLSEEDRQFLQWLDESIATAEHATPATDVEPPSSRPAGSMASHDRPWGPEHTGASGGGIGDWRTLWSDLELTEAEQMRLRQGFLLGIQRWQAMSPEQREAQAERFRALGQRWQMMSDEERQRASQRMRDRFEEWRHSGQAELPDVSELEQLLD